MHKEILYAPEEVTAAADELDLDQKPGVLQDALTQADELPSEAVILNSYATSFNAFVGYSRKKGASTMQDAEDIAQISFLKAWIHRDTFDGDNINGWMAKIVRNTTYDKGRSAMRQSKIIEPEINEEREWKIFQVPSDFDIDSDFEIQEMRSELDQVLADIPDEQRAVVELMYFEELSYSEIAKALDIPIGTVKSRANRGMNKLREIFLSNPLMVEHFF